MAMSIIKQVRTNLLANIGSRCNMWQLGVLMSCWRSTNNLCSVSSRYFDYRHSNWFAVVEKGLRIVTIYCWITVDWLVHSKNSQKILFAFIQPYFSQILSKMKLCCKFINRHPFFALESGRPDFWKIRSTLFWALVLRIRAWFLK